MKILARIFAKTPVVLSAFFMTLAVATFDIPCALFLGQPKMPEKLRK